MNILIIGGQGFVGQYLVKELVKNPLNNITVVSRKINVDQYISINSLENVEIITGVDIVNREEILKYFKNKDIVFNLAGLISFKQKDKLKLKEINYLGALNVANACEEMGVGKLIHLSSTAALGFSNSIINENFKFDWSKAKKCVYSISKSLANKALEKNKCNTIIVYPSLILGPGDNTNTLKLINAIKYKKIPFNAPGGNSIVDVRDLARALVFLVDLKNNKNKYIVAGGSYSFKEVNKRIAENLNVKVLEFVAPKLMLYPLLFFVNVLELFSKNPPITYENIYLSFKDRKHSSERLKDLGFEFKYSLDKTIKDSILWSKKVKKEK